MRKILLLLAVAAIHVTISAQSNIDPDLEKVRNRIISDMLGTGVNMDQVKKLASTIRLDGTWPGINYKDVSRTGFEHRIHLENMVTLSKAVNLYNDTAAWRAVMMALDFWIKNDFICQNWWWNEMGTPNLMINTLLLLDTKATDKQISAALKIARRANLEASGARPGGDLIQIAGMLGKQALYMRNADTLNRVIKTMASEIKIATGRGLQADLSFHHRVDNVISTLSYGLGYASAFSYWASMTVGTKYALPESGLKLLTDFYLDGICASMAFGKFPDPGAKNRDISRMGTLNAAGMDLPLNLMKASPYRSNELKQIIKAREAEHPTGGTRDIFFWHSEYYTSQRPNYFASVRMHSSRQNNMEQPHNEEGLKNHHYGDGSTWLTMTGKEFVNIWPAFDWQKIPGTTIVQQPALPHWNELAKKGLTDFVGGVTNGKYGAAAFDFACVHDPLKAKKSYFFFDKEYVCLGAGIQSKAEYPVATTVNQCLLTGDVSVRTEEGHKLISRGKHSLNDVQWVWHNEVAYIFPEPANINCNNTTAAGSWRSINHQSWATDSLVKKDIFTLWFDHGPRPVAATYAYIIMPNVPLAHTQRNAGKNVRVKILSNTPELQAVHHNKLNITQAVFYAAGKIELPGGASITVDKPCMVLAEMSGKNIKKMVVSDPSRKLKELQLTITKGGNPKTTKVELPQDGFAGSSVTVSL